MPTPSHAAPQLWQAVRQERETSRCKGKLCIQQDHEYRKSKTSIQNSDFYFFPKLLIFYLPRRCKSKPQWDGSSLWPSHMSNFKSQGQRRWISQWRACPTSMQTCVGSPTPKERSWKNLLVIQALSRQTIDECCPKILQLKCSSLQFSKPWVPGRYPVSKDKVNVTTFKVVLWPPYMCTHMHT